MEQQLEWVSHCLAMFQDGFQCGVGSGKDKQGQKAGAVGVGMGSEFMMSGFSVWALGDVDMGGNVESITFCCSREV